MAAGPTRDAGAAATAAPPDAASNSGTPATSATDPSRDATAPGAAASASAPEEPAPDRGMAAAAHRTVDADELAVPVQVTLGGRGARRTPILIAFDNAQLRRSVLLIILLFVLARLGMWAFGRIDQLLLAVLLAWLLAISMEPAIRPLAARGVRRGAAVGIVMIGGVLLVAGLVAAFGGAFFSQMADLARALPGLAQRGVIWLNETFSLTFDPDALANTLNTNTSQIANIATQLAGGVVGIIGGLAAWVFQLATVALFAYYLAADGPRLRRAIGRLLPSSQQRVFVTVWDTAVTKTGGYVVSKALLALISTLAHAIAFSWLDVPFWLPMALWVGVTSQFLPVVGTYLGIALPVLATVFTHPWDALAIIIFATLYQQLENYILVPRISRRTMDIHPAVAFASVVAGIAMFGWIGGLVAIPLTAAAISVISAYGHRYELIPELGEIEAREEAAPGGPPVPPGLA
jgi:predicted PurR-regulated permease PerM